ncbi:GntR family transcriptional regulator [Xylocopilactobacillus apicola]|nr:GntR family transcriptional regulator [Xylocopilactobacillus apicola]
MNLTFQAYTTILQKIINTTYQPGQKLSEKDLIQELQIGRTPVREAILRLRQNGLVEAIPQSGTYITKIDIEVAENARFIRESIETQVIKEAAAMNNELEFVRLNAIITNQKSFMKKKQFENFFKEDEAFHQAFYQMTGKEQAWDWLQTINMQLNRFRMLRLKADNLPWDALTNEHEKILAAVKKHEAEEAVQLVKNHLHLMLGEKEALINRFPEFFTNISEQ